MAPGRRQSLGFEGVGLSCGRREIMVQLTASYSYPSCGGKGQKLESERKELRSAIHTDGLDGPHHQAKIRQPMDEAHSIFIGN